MFTWVEGGFDPAREHPDVLAVWEPINPLLEERGTLPKWDFPHYKRLSLRMTGLPRGITDLEELQAVFGALGHQSRRTILTVLHARGGEMSSGKIASRFDCSWPTTTRHLRILEAAGLVSVALRGRERVYRLDAQRLCQVTGAWLSRFTGASPGEGPSPGHSRQWGPNSASPQSQ